MSPCYILLYEDVEVDFCRSFVGPPPAYSRMNTYCFYLQLVYLPVKKNI